MRSAMACTSCIRCEMNKIATPRRFRSRSTSNMASTCLLVKAEVASSRIRSLGLRNRALAISTSCRSARDSSDADAADAVQYGACIIIGGTLQKPEARSRRGDHDVVANGQVRHQRQLLEHA